MIHISLDLETWGKRPGCDIRSIGACVFDPVAGLYHPSHYGAKPDQTFYVATDNPTCLPKQIEVAPGEFQEYRTLGDYMPMYSLHRDPETVKWWSEQSAEAQAAFADPVDLSDALISFSGWFHGTVNRDIERINTIKIWANDPQFDVSILSEVFHAVGLPVPWHYRAPRSLRTITEAAGMTRDDFAAFNFGTAHNALDDAIAQAGIVCEAYKRLGLSNARVAE